MVDAFARALAPWFLRGATAFGMVIALGACGGLSTTSGSSARATNEESPGPAQSGTRSGVAGAYDAWSYRSCAKSDCSQQLAASAGIYPDGQRGGALENPKSRMENPDPEWLPGWAQLPDDERGATQVFAALSLAASRKTWWNDCRARYEDLSRGVDDRLEAAQKAIAAARAIEEPHARSKAHFELPSRAKGQPASRFPELREGFDAAAYETERAIADELRARDRLWLLTFEGIGPPASSRAILAPRLEGDLGLVAFCMRAVEKGYDDALPPLVDQPRPEVAAVVKPLVSDEQKAAVERARRERDERAKRELGLDVERPAKVRQIASKELPEGLRFQVKDGKATVETSERRSYDRSIGEVCVDSQTRIGACPTMKVNKEERRTVTFESWPTGLTLEPGDQILYFGIIDESEVTGSGTPVEKHVEKIRGLHLQTVEKKGGTMIHYLGDPKKR